MIGQNDIHHLEPLIQTMIFEAQGLDILAKEMEHTRADRDTVSNLRYQSGEIKRFAHIIRDWAISMRREEEE